MKKQKKLKLGKISIAGISTLNSIVGGAPDSIVICITRDQACLTDLCNTDTGGPCSTTLHTRANSDYCGGNDPSQGGEIC
ncbi:hypothetical protein [Kordia jejudonensis]|uniref:hypothetical protein n=1 Tax=Kordia jejudonensis TaxID=1348245 RepID=UPI000629BCB4|nr:hypothetical protein [Kordia jejudonensis]